MMRRLLLILLGLILATGLGVAFLARHSFQREDVEVPAPWSAKARENDTLLLERWLARQGWQVHRSGGFFQGAELPDRGLLILLRLGPSPLSEREVDALLAWVRAGGRLLVDGSADPFNSAEGTEALFKRLGAELIELPEPSEGEPRRTWDDTDQFEEDNATYALHRNPIFRVKVEEGAWPWTMGSEDGQVLVSREEGKGWVALASDLGFLYNHSFSELDHAAWLARILGEPAPGQAVVVWSKPMQPSLPSWLWQRAWAFLLACAALFTAWLWLGLWRFGPWLPEAPTGRRSLLEHLVSSGRFLWRHGGGPEALLAVSRAAVLRRAQRLHPAFPSLPETEGWAYLASRSGLSESEVAEALDDRPGANQETLARRLQMLQHLRHRLSLKS